MRDPIDTLTHLVEASPVAAYLGPAEVRRLGDRRRQRRTAAVVAAGLVLVVGGAALVVHPKHEADNPPPVKQVKVAQVLGPDGYGPVKLGMTLARAKATGVIVVGGTAEPGETCVPFRFAGQRLSKDQIGSGYISRKHGVVAIFAVQDMQTPEGIHNGSTEAEARATYPHAESRINGWFDRLSPAGAKPEVDYRYSFAGGKVSDLFLQRSDQDCYE